MAYGEVRASRIKTQEALRANAHHRKQLIGLSARAIKLVASFEKAFEQKLSKTRRSRIRRAQSALDSLHERAQAAGTRTSTVAKAMDRVLSAWEDLGRRTSIEQKRRQIAIENEIMLLNGHLRFMVDAQSIIEDPKLAMHLHSRWSYEKEWRRLARGLRPRYPRFHGYHIRVEDHWDGIRLILKGTPLPDPVRSWEKLFAPLEQEVDAYLAWELRKVGLDMKFSSEVQERTLTYQIKSERIAPRDPNVCENCGATVASLHHYTDHCCDEFLCGRCYSGYLMCMDP